MLSGPPLVTGNLLDTLPYILGLLVFIRLFQWLLPRLLLAIAIAIGWMIRRVTGRAAPQPARVRVAANIITYCPPRGPARQVALPALREVALFTDDSGPFTPDVWWLLDDGSGSMAVIPNEAEGIAAMLALLQALPGFDNTAVINAMTCTEPARFPVWQQPANAPRPPSGQPISD